MERMTTTIKLVNGALEVTFGYSQAKVDAIKRLAPGTRAWDGQRKVWVVDINCFEELLELLPDTMDIPVEIWERVYPSMGARIPDVLAQCKRWAESGVRLVRCGETFIAEHNTAPQKDLSALQPHIDEMTDDINRLLAMGHKVPGVYAEPVLTGEDARMFAFMQTVRENRGKWEKNAQKKRMLAKGRYHG